MQHMQTMMANPSMQNAMMQMMQDPNMQSAVMQQLGGGGGGAPALLGNLGNLGGGFPALGAPPAGAPAPPAAVPGAGAPGATDFGSVLSSFFGQQGAGGGVQPPSSEPPEIRYASQISALCDMGFIDAEANVRALTATGGNVSAAVERLLSGV